MFVLSLALCDILHIFTILPICAEGADKHQAVKQTFVAVMPNDFYSLFV